MKRVFHNPIYWEQYLDKGYIIIDLLNPEELEEVVDAVGQMSPDDRFNPDEYPVNAYNTSSYHCTFLDTNKEYKRLFNEFSREFFLGKLNQYLVDYNILTSNLYVKPAGTGEFQVHQNWPTTCNFEDITLTAWVPLHDVDEENGTIHVVEGSHKLWHEIENPSLPKFYDSFESCLKKDYLKPVKLRAGQAIVFCDSLIHWSPTNKSKNPRKAIQIELIPKEIEPVVFHYRAELNEFEVFVVDFDFFIDNSIDAIIETPTMLKRLSNIPNPNKTVKKAEFDSYLQNSIKIRREFFAE